MFPFTHDFQNRNRKYSSALLEQRFLGFKQQMQSPSFAEMTTIPWYILGKLYVSHLYNCPNKPLS